MRKLFIIALFVLGIYNAPMFGMAQEIIGWTIYPVEFDDVYTASSLAPAKKTISSYPWSNLIFCHYGLEGVSFIISSKHMTITSDNENLVEIVE